MIKEFIDSMLEEAHLIRSVNKLIGLLKNRNYGDRDRLIRKLLEEMGEYAEAVEFDNGATRKVAKFKGLNSKTKLKEEISDVIMVAFALARFEGYTVEDVLEVIVCKLSKREDEYQKSLKEDK
jgi:NTP pyrophosphatase (non-canonical NTP hydrolase)